MILSLVVKVYVNIRNFKLGVKVNIVIKYKVLLWVFFELVMGI